jgi:hypothetical protein
VWYNKQIPKRRKNVEWQAKTRKGRDALNETDIKEGYLVTVESIKSQVLEIEQLYSSTLGNTEKEWGSETVREEMTAAIQSVEQPNQIFDLLIKLDQGLCNPVQVTRKQLEADEKEAWITARELAVKN